jgi:hypothetical protein
VKHSLKITLIVGVLSTGCLYIPTKEHSWSEVGTKANPDPKVIEGVVPGLAREQVLLQLGEPDAVSDGGDIFVYQWDKNFAYMPFIAGGGYQGAAGVAAFKRGYAMIITFENNCVSNAEVRKPDGQGWDGVKGGGVAEVDWK